MRLFKLVESINNKNKLSLSIKDMRSITSSCIFAGLSRDLVSKKDIHIAKDIILDQVNYVKKCNASYNPLNKPIKSSNFNKCPVCSQVMGYVKLATGRKVFYCKQDRVALPIKEN